MCKRNGFSTGPKWYEHTPEKMLENDSVKILWYFSEKPDHKLEYNKPDIITVDKETGENHIIDVAYPFHRRLNEKEQ